jgi:DNA-binding MarR family transcriptional regulator
MKNTKRSSIKQRTKQVSPGDDPNMTLWVLLDQSRDLVAKARDLELNHFDLTMAQAANLFILLNNNKGRGLTIKEISNWNGREPNSVLNLINRMERNGLVKKSRDPGEAKAIISITEKGRELYSNATRLSIEMIFSVLSEIDKEQLQSCLKKIRAKSRELLGMDFRPPFLP